MASPHNTSKLNSAICSLNALGHRIRCIEVVQARSNIVCKASLERPWSAEFPSSIVALRIQEPGQKPTDELDVATLLNSKSAPAVRPVIRRPIEGNGVSVTVWEWINRARPTTDVFQFGQTLARLHQVEPHGLKRSTAFKPPSSVLAKAHESMRKASDADKGHFSTYVSALVDAYAQVDSCLKKSPTGFVHGTWRPDNVLDDPSEGLLAIDFEHSGVGHLWSDFVNVGLAVRRFGWPASYWDSFRSGYGPDAPTLDEIAPLVRLKELVTLGYSLRASKNDLRHKNELHKRLPALSDPLAPTPKWTMIPYTEQLDVRMAEASPVDRPDLGRTISLA
jgi:hypothetical protein